MGRKAKAVPVRATEILPNALYTIEELPALVRMSVKFLRREVALGGLECRRVGGKLIFRGQWLLQWLERREAGQAPPADCPPPALIPANA